MYLILVQGGQEADVSAMKERMTYKLGKRLIQAATSSRLDPDSLRHYLTSLRTQYCKDLSDIEQGVLRTPSDSEP